MVRVGCKFEYLKNKGTFLWNSVPNSGFRKIPQLRVDRRNGRKCCQLQWTLSLINQRRSSVAVYRNKQTQHGGRRAGLSVTCTVCWRRRRCPSIIFRTMLLATAASLSSSFDEELVRSSTSPTINPAYYSFTGLNVCIYELLCVSSWIFYCVYLYAFFFVMLKMICNDFFYQID